MTRAEQKASEALELVAGYETAIKEMAAKNEALNNRLNTLERAVAQLGAVIREMKTVAREMPTATG